MVVCLLISFSLLCSLNFTVETTDNKMGGEGSRDGNADVRNAIFAGVKSAAITSFVTHVSVTLAVRHISWAKRNLNHTGRALIPCGAALFMFALTTDQVILETQRKNTRYK